MPTFDFSATDAYAVTSPPALVSALKSVVLPALGRPTIPTCSGSSAQSPKPTRDSRAKRFAYSTRGSASRTFPSCASSSSAPAVPAFSACSRASALFVVTSMLRIWPPSSPISTRANSFSLVSGNHLREDAVHGVGMDERDFETVEAPPRHLGR